MNGPARLSLLPDWVKFFGLTLGGIALALGRYDWSVIPAQAFRAWTLSGYFFTLVLSAIWLLGKVLDWSASRRFWPVLGLVTCLLNLPYRWLGLAPWFYLEHHPGGYGYEKTFTPEWLLRGRSAISWDGTDSLLLSLLGLSALGWWLDHRKAKSGLGRNFFGRLGPLGFFSLLTGFMTVEMWLHLSNRSPYTYISHYEQPEANHYVYAYNLLPNGRGAVNADVGYFLELEDLFQGRGPGPHMLLVRRAFSFYLSSHLSYFLGAYHAFLILNLGFWIAAAAAMYYFTRNVTGSPVAGAAAAALVACGPGFIMYAAQPMAYLPGFAVLALVVFFYQRLLAQSHLASWSALGAAGILFGITLLTYDNFSWSLFFLGYALAVRASVVRAAASVLCGVAIYAGFLLLIFHVFNYPPPDHQNDRYMAEAARHALGVLRHPGSGPLLRMTPDFCGKYFSQLLQVNFYLPVVLGCLGFVLAPRHSSVRTVALLLLVPSAAAFAVLYFGESFLASYSRFNYAAYPAIVLLAAVGIERTVEHFQRRARPKVAGLALALPLLAYAVLVNLDAFGLLPQLYFHFYFSSGGSFS